MVRLIQMALLAVTIAGSALGCDACNDRDAFKSSFVSSVNSAAEAAAASSQPAAVQAAAPQAAPQERTTADSPAYAPTSINQAPTRSPSSRIRSFNELR